MLIRGTIVAFDSMTHTATIRADGSTAQALDAVAVSRAIPSGEMTAGRRVLLAASDHGDAADLVVIAVYV